MLDLYGIVGQQIQLFDGEPVEIVSLLSLCEEKPTGLPCDKGSS